jgi:hypothetical protein
MPESHEYRPIVVLSPVIKFLEGFLVKTLKKYCKERLNRHQYGFVPGLSIEECKERVLQEVARRRARAAGTAMAFVDFR